MTQKEWFADWFDTSYYHTLYQHRSDNEARIFIENLVRLLQPKAGATALDLACGKGRHARTLHQLGLQVTGVDLSANSIQAAKQYETTGLHFQTHDMREVFPETFDYVFNLFTSFGYFDHASENEKVCDAIATMLDEQGVLVIDFMNAQKVIAQLVENEQKTLDGITFHITREYNGTHIFKHIAFEDKGHAYRFTERVQALQLADFESLLHKRFRIMHTFGTFQLDAFHPETSDRLILIAAKK